MAGLTAALAGFVAGVEAGALPERAVAAARMGMIDCLGVMIAGSGEDATRLVAAVVGEPAAGDDAPEIPSGRRLAVADAALVNGVAAHALDYDDVALDGHTSAVMTPAILAEGWALGASGRDALAAYVAGYEVWALLRALEPGALHERGFHPTAIWGTLAAAAACARLNRLGPAETAHALAIAASLAAGLVANFGSMTKPLHVGRTAQAGVLAARLAKSGFTGAPDVLEHGTGFLRAHSPSGAPALAGDDLRLGHRWRLPELGVSIKRYPLCYCAHRAIDAMLDLAHAHDLAPAAVVAIEVRIGRTQRLILRHQAPRTGLEAKFSIEFALAAALVARRVGLAELTDPFVQRPDVIAAMAKVRCTTTDARLPDVPFAPDDRVAVVLQSGERLEHPPVAHAKGSWQEPLSEALLWAKFADCADDRLGREQAAALFRKLAELEQLASLRDLPLIRDVSTPVATAVGRHGAQL